MTACAWSAVTTALAQEVDVPRTGVELSWVRLAGAEHCPGADEIRASVVALLGHDPFEGRPYLRIEGVASRPEAGWTAVLFFRDPHGQSLGSRDITSGAATCESLAEAVVFATALALDPRVALDEDAPAVRLADAEAGGRAGPTGSAEAVSEPARASGRGAVHVGLLVSGGSLPRSPAPGGVLGVRGPTIFEFLSGGLGAFVLPAREGGEVGMSLAGGWAEVCAGRSPFRWLELRACPRLLFGAYTVYLLPGELEASNQGLYSWLALGLGVELLARIVGPFGLSLDVTPVFSLTRQSFTAAGRAEPLFAEDPVGVMAQVGLSTAF